MCMFVLLLVLHGQLILHGIMANEDGIGKCVERQGTSLVCSHGGWRKGYRTRYMVNRADERIALDTDTGHARIQRFVCILLVANWLNWLYLLSLGKEHFSR